jgi:hypothetical protein
MGCHDNMTGCKPSTPTPIPIPPNITSSGVISDSDVRVIPGEEPYQDKVGDLLLSCGENVGTHIALRTAHCDSVVDYVVNYCMGHMNDTMAQDNKQVCWDRNVMVQGLRYAAAYLDTPSNSNGFQGGGTGKMVKAQSDILATIDKAYANFLASGLSKSSFEGNLTKCFEGNLTIGGPFSFDQRLRPDIFKLCPTPYIHGLLKAKTDENSSGEPIVNDSGTLTNWTHVFSSGQTDLHGLFAQGYNRYFGINVNYTQTHDIKGIRLSSYQTPSGALFADVESIVFPSGKEMRIPSQNIGIP